MSNSHKGHKLTPETRRKLSQVRKGLLVGSRNPMFGKHLTEEQKRKISEVQRGQKWYHNPITGEVRRFHDNDTIPEGFVRGYGKFNKRP